MDVLQRPIVTEKLTASGEKFNRYGFIVDKKANKIQIKKAVEDMYRVTVEKVATINSMGKNKSRFTKAGAISGRKPNIKKAYVTLKKGDKINFHSAV